MAEPQISSQCPAVQPPPPAQQQALSVENDQDKVSSRHLLHHSPSHSHGPLKYLVSHLTSHGKNVRVIAQALQDKLHVSFSAWRA